MKFSVRSRFRWVAVGMICTSGLPVALATPFSRPAEVTNCIGGMSQQFCQPLGQLAGPIGIVPPFMLIDLNALSAVSDLQGSATLDRSAEMDRDGATRTVPVVMGPGMLISVQLSFDSRMDLSSETWEPLAWKRSAGRQGGGPATPSRSAEFARIELTLGSVLQGSGGGDKRIDELRLSANNGGYVSFALVNQFHVAAPRAAQEEPEEDESVLQ